MRWYILRTLLYKELLRHLANRGGLALAALLVAAAMLLSFFHGGNGGTNALLGGVNKCYVDYWEEGPWIRHLREHVPEHLHGRIYFRSAREVPTANGLLTYELGAGAIQVRTLSGTGAPGYKVWFWYPGGDSAVLAPYEAWFWNETRRFVQEQAGHVSPGIQTAAHIPIIEEEHSSLHGTADTHSAIATGLVLFALFFVCVYLLPSLTCEERERGALLAQALSPASPLEILAAKFLFYPVFGIVLAAVIAGVYRPAVLAAPFFWLAAVVASFGALGIGMVISSLARTQRAASMGALGYMLIVAIILLICQQNRVPFVPYLALEYHCPRMIQAALAGTVGFFHWGHLGAATLLAILWSVLAADLFRRRGWQ